MASNGEQSDSVLPENDPGKRGSRSKVRVTWVRGGLAAVVVCIALFIGFVQLGRGGLRCSPISTTLSSGDERLAFFRRRAAGGTGDDITNYKYSIYVMNTEGRCQQLTERSGTDFAWSPDGSRIAFIGYPDKKSSTGDIYVMGADGSDVVRLTYVEASYPGYVGGAASLSWSPDGQQITFSGSLNDEANEDLIHPIFIVNADGSGLERFTHGYDPVWSPDSQQIAFRCGRDPGPNHGVDICVSNADLSDLRRLAEGRDPVWSPDGQQIAFWSEEGVSVVDADGSDLRRLAEGRNPVWSPDGQQIAFNIGVSLLVINPDGSNLRLLASEGRDAVWSPDSQRIAYKASHQIERSVHLDSYVINADGSGQRLLGENVASESPASWSPDGQQIAFECDRDICVANAEGGDLRKVATVNNRVSAVWPQWAP
jgi:Tol biopolymer transport system component